MNFESSLFCAAWQWFYTADETWLFDCFKMLFNVLEAKTESASEFTVEFIVYDYTI